MSLFWTSLFAHLKNCGRNAAFFIIALAGVFILVLLCAWFCASGLLQYLGPVQPWLGLLAAIWACASLRRALARRRERLQRVPLSDHELQVARARLLKSRR